MMGNPNAKVKLLEIGSLSCPHCKAFDDEGVPTLIENYVKPGKVSWEFRPYVIHGPIDMAANLVIRCNGLKTFFPLAQRALQRPGGLAGQDRGRPAGQDQRDAEPADRTRCSWLLRARVGCRTGPRRAACRRRRATMPQQPEDDRPGGSDRRPTSTRSIPDFSGTPAFVINGKMLKDTASWDKLKPQLDAALK